MEPFIQKKTDPSSYFLGRGHLCSTGAPLTLQTLIYKMKKIVLIVSLCTLGFPLLAQQYPLYAQYFNNPMLINPAIAGTSQRLMVGAAYRLQWAGMPGGPVTYNFNGHIALDNNRVGVGVLAVQDQIGDIRNTQFGSVFSYRLRFKDKSFYFGMQAGATRYATDAGEVRVKNNPDPLFGQYSETRFNAGAGVLLLGKQFMLGLSVPQLLNNDVSLGGQAVEVYRTNFYFFGSYSINLGKQIQMKPSTLLRYTRNTPLSADLNFNFVFNQLYTAGLITRNLNTYGLLLQMVMKNYRFGYVFEVPGKQSSLRYITHEVSLSFSLNVLPFHNHPGNGFW